MHEKQLKTHEQKPITSHTSQANPDQIVLSEMIDSSSIAIPVEHIHPHTNSHTPEEVIPEEAIPEEVKGDYCQEPV